MSKYTLGITLIFGALTSAPHLFPSPTNFQSKNFQVAQQMLTWRRENGMQAGEQEQQQPQASTSGRAEDTSQPPRSAARGHTPQPDVSLSPISRAMSQPGTSRMSRVRFWLHFHAQFGQRVRIVGSHENLGEPGSPSVYPSCPASA